MATHDTAAIFDWLLPGIALQGISDRAAFAFAARAGTATWDDVAVSLAGRPSCPKLACHWRFDNCDYRKDAFRCAEPGHVETCPVPLLPAHKGGLAVAAVALWLFFRDACGGDLVGWIDRRLAAADPGRGIPVRAAAMRDAVLGPLCEVAGIGPKVWSMLLADLLIAGDPGRERWVATGASMVAVDSLVHNYLHRTGALRRCGAEHAYGSACYGPGGCSTLIEDLAELVDARAVDPAAPACCPRLVQHSLWHFCAEGGWSICNGRQIDDRARCQQPFCPARPGCDRIALHPPAPPSEARSAAKSKL